MAQVRVAAKDRGLTVQQLLDKSRLCLDRSGLQRKLQEQTPATTAECEALAKALDITLKYRAPVSLANKRRKAA